MIIFTAPSSPPHRGGEGRVRGMVTPRRKLERKNLFVNRTRAREMRRKPVAMEKLFWSVVRNRQLGGHKFKRQVLIGPYIVDFVCTEKMLIVELDGRLHDKRVDYDRIREGSLAAQGYRVIRIKNDDIASAFAAMLAMIKHELDTPSPNLSPAARGRGGSIT
jgi:very-short-patch-repair endonuclease